MSQGAAAAIVHVEQPTWSRWETGTWQPESVMRRGLRLLTARNPIEEAPHGIPEDAWDTPKGGAELDRIRKSIQTIPEGDVPPARDVVEVILEAFDAAKKNGLTCYEVEQTLSIPHQTARARMHDLAKAGCIALNGKRRKTERSYAAVYVRTSKAFTPKAKKS